MGRLHDRRLPGESDEYRAARDELLAAEVELRDAVERVAAMRSRLPLGAPVGEDYEFEEAVLPDGGVRRVTLSGLFEEGRDSLIVYQYMWAPDWEKPCPMCTAIVDNLDGNALHARRRTNLVVIAKAPAARLAEMAAARGWRHIRLASSYGTTFNRDYLAEWESDHGSQHPMINVFARRDGAIHHFWSSEAMFVDRGGDPRHADMIWGLWNLLDLTPEGRGTEWYPSLEY